jgi:hypothetical protein
MAQFIFTNDAAGQAQADAIPQPKHEWIDGRRLVILTGNDMPVSLSANDVVLNRLRLFQGALLAGGQPLLNDFTTYIYTTIPASGTPTQKNFWRESQEFTRALPFINQLRTAIQGAKSNAASIAEMNQVFVLGSGYTP